MSSKAIGSGITLTSDLYAAFESELAKSESNDCVVRALALAAELDYDRVHSLLKIYGRKPKKGTYDGTVFKTIGYLNEFNPKKFKKFELYQMPAIKTRYVTVGQFCKAYPEGTYYLHRRGHAFVIKDGVVHDWYYGSTTNKSRIISCFKVG